MASLPLADDESKNVFFDLNSDVGKSSLIGITLGTCACVMFRSRIEEYLRKNELPDDLRDACLADKFDQWEAYKAKLDDKGKDRIGYYPSKEIFTRQMKEANSKGRTGFSDFYFRYIAEMNPGSDFLFKKNSDHIYRTCFDLAIIDFGYLSSSIAGYRIKWAIIKSIRYSLEYMARTLPDGKEKKLFEMLHEMSSFGYDEDSSMWLNRDQPSDYNGLLAVQKDIIDDGSLVLRYSDKEDALDISIAPASMAAGLREISHFVRGMAVDQKRLVFNCDSSSKEEAVVKNEKGQPVSKFEIDEHYDDIRYIAKKQVSSFKTVNHPGGISYEILRKSYVDYAGVLKTISDNIAKGVSTIVYGGTGSGKTAACFISLVEQFNRSLEDPKTARTPFALHPEKLIIQFDDSAGRPDSKDIVLYECEEFKTVPIDSLAKQACVFIYNMEPFFSDKHDAVFRAINSLFKVPMVIFCNYEMHQTLTG